MGAGAGEFKEKSTHSMNLPHDDSETIDRLTQWIYSKDIPFNNNSIGQSNDYGSVPLMQLAALYVAANKFGIVKLKNQATDELWKLLALSPEEVKVEDKMIGYVYENTVKGSNLRRLLVHWQAHSISLVHKNMKKLGRDHPQFAACLLARMSKHNRNPWKCWEGKWAYREYEGDDGDEDDYGDSDDDDDEVEDDEDEDDKAGDDEN